MKNSPRIDLSRLVVGRRRRYVVLGVWVLAAAALGPLAGRFEQASVFVPLPPRADDAQDDRLDERVTS